MSERRGGGRFWRLLLFLLVAGGGAGAAGHFYPNIPYLGPIVQRIKQSSVAKKLASEVTAHRGYGVYSIKVEEVSLDPYEFKDGETIDLQFILEQIDMNGKTLERFDSKDWGANRLKQGEGPLVGRWPSRPLKISWHKGDRFKVTVRDATLTGGDLCEWETDVTATQFPLEGIHVFEQVRGKPPRTPQGNRIQFSVTRLGDLPATEQ